MDAHAGGGAHLGGDVLVGETHLIVSRGRAFLIVGESRIGGVSGRWKQQDVNQVACPGAAQSGVGETIDAVVVVMITRRIVPVGGRMGIGAELHHPERHRGTGIVVATQETAFLHHACTDKRVDVTGKVTCRHTGGDK